MSSSSHLHTFITVLLFQRSHLVDCARGPLSPTSHHPTSLAAKPPARDLLKWNIWFHFEVPKHLNHLAGTDAGRAVKLLCLAAGSPCPGGERGGEQRRGVGRHQTPVSGSAATAGCCVFVPSGTMIEGAVSGSKMGIVSSSASDLRHHCSHMHVLNQC